MASLIAAIRNAVHRDPTHALDAIEVEPGADAPANPAPPSEAETTGGTMSTQTQGGANPAVTAAIAAATLPQGKAAEGYTAAMARIDAILSAEGIKGDAARMTAALDLAKTAGEMSAEAIVGFVTANVPANKPEASAPAPAQPAADVRPDPAAYEAQRAASAGLAQPGKGPKAAKDQGWGDVVAEVNKRRN